MTMTQHFTGLIAATLTPMRADGSLNLAKVGPMVDFLARQGITGLYVCGSTGEGPLLTSDERRATAAAYVEAAKGRLPVIVHVGHSSPADARLLAAHAQQIGADAVAAVSPWYFKPNSVDVLLASLAEVAGGAPELPFYYYHIPALTGVAVDMIEFLRRGPERIPTLQGVKYTAPTVDEFQAMVAFDDGRFDVLYGRDEMLLCGLAAGAKGAVGSTYNFAAPIYRRVIEAFERNDVATARQWQARSIAMVQILLKTQSLSFSKFMMRLLGHECGPVRLPLVTIDAQEEARLEKQLRDIGYFDWIA
jgi:N-acetylneuraminate lyase